MAAVWGWLGSPSTSSAAPCSTTAPAWRTTTSSATRRATSGSRLATSTAVSPLARQAVDQLEDALTDVVLHAQEGLVEEEHVGPSGQRLGDLDALAHPRHGHRRAPGHAEHDATGGRGHRRIRFVRGRGRVHELDGVGTQPSTAIAGHPGDVDAVEQDRAGHGSEIESDAAQQL